jgi:hypothetical protein
VSSHPRDSWRLLGKPPLYWILFLHYREGSSCPGDSGDIFHVPLVLVPCEDFVLGARLCDNTESN